MAVDPTRLAAPAPSSAVLQTEVAASFPLSFMAANAAVETAAKESSAARVEARLRTLVKTWPDILAHLNAHLPKAGRVRRWLETAGGSATAASLGIPAKKHAQDHARARMIRRRFTGLDLLHDLGWLERAVHELFAPGGFWFNEGRKT
jgi:glycerol-1-phosphate dehydrogenase [NAD(P)+]